MSETVTARSEQGTRCWGLGTRENPSQPGPQNSASGYARDRLGCEMAAEVLRSSGGLRLRVTGTSMLPAVWPGDVLSVRRDDVAEALPGDIVLFGCEGRLVAHRVVTVSKSGVRSPKSEVSPEWRVPSGESRIVVTRGDSLAQDDPPISGREILGRVTAIERGSRRVTPRLTFCRRIGSSILSRSNFCTRLVLWLRKTGIRVLEIRAQDSKFKIPDSRFPIKIQDQDS